ncbi:hypothetical protein IWW42_001258 [Coemansia sp. RSA 1085]|nr:hypothetical protein IWW42_001258 [Coemansia sp. RSA 1085]
MEERVVELTQGMRSAEARNRKLERRVTELETRVAELQTAFLEMFQSAVTRLQGVVSKAHPTATNAVPKTHISKDSNQDPPNHAPTAKAPCFEASQEICFIDKKPSRELSRENGILENRISLYPSEEARSRSRLPARGRASRRDTVPLSGHTLHDGSHGRRQHTPPHLSKSGWSCDQDKIAEMETDEIHSYKHGRRNSRSRGRSRSLSRGSSRGRSHSRSRRSYRRSRYSDRRRSRCESQSPTDGRRSRSSRYLDRRKSRRESRSPTNSRNVKRRRGIDATSSTLKHSNGVSDSWKVEEASVSSGDPVMPVSVKQIMEGTAAVETSVEEKIQAWQASSIQGLESDSDDPLSMLQSRGLRWREPLRDASGEQLTLERLSRVWGECGWVPMDDIPQLYYKYYGVDMWPRGEARKAHSCLRDMSGLGEWQQAGGKLLLFLQGSHLKSPRHFKRLFVRPNVPQSLLFFFLVTTVLRPLELDQGPVVMKLWKDNFSRSPMQVPVAAQSDGPAGEKWADINGMWQDAVSWLQSLARSAACYGRKYLADKVVAWGPDLLPSDADAGLVSGLSREELLGLLRIAPILLRSVMHPDDILSLEDELAEPI